MPCAPSGIIYDLLEVLSQYLSTIGLRQTKFFVVSPVAENSLAYANILGEWYPTGWVRHRRAFRRPPAG